MKYLKLFATLLFCLVLFTCERDDICASTTPTTPRLFIEFFDITDRELLKDVVRLTVYGEGLVIDENGDPIEPETASNAIIRDIENLDNFIFNVNENRIALPLRVGNEGEATTTRFVFEKETNLRLANGTGSNIDIVEITYTPQFEYVSRACGFKSVFTNLAITVEDDGDLWLLDTDFPNTDDVLITVENENQTHVHLFH